MEIEKIYIDPDELLYRFDHGLNCAMCVFGTMAPDIGFNTEEAHRIASLLGGGMGRSETCGCVTGAYMVLGHKFANDRVGDVEKLNHAKEKREEFNERFIKKYGSLNCCEMLGGLRNCDPGELDIIMEKNLYRTVCTRAINTACKIVEDLLKEE